MTGIQTISSSPDHAKSNDKVYLPETYAYQYTFAKLDVGKEYLTIYVETDVKPQIIHE